MAYCCYFVVYLSLFLDCMAVGWGKINRVGGVYSSDSFTWCCFAVQLCETTSCVGFHDHQGTGTGISWVSEVYNFSIKLDSLWPVCPPDLWLDGVNTNMAVELGYKEVCVLGHAFLCYFR